MLAGHSRIEIPPETWFLIDLVRELPLYEPLDAAQVDRAIVLTTTNYRWPDLEIDKDQFATRVHGLAVPTIRAIADIIYGEFRARSGKPRCGDKTPPYVGILPQLAELYPEARCIHLLRDGRDVTLSYIDAGLPGAFWDPAFEWRRAVHHVERARRADLSDRILEVRYEQLVRDPEHTLREICGFLGEEFEPGMLRYQSAANKVPERERHIHPNLTRPVRRDNAERWRTSLTVAEQFALESCLSHELELAGYGLRFDGPLWRRTRGLAEIALRRSGPVLGKASRFLNRRRLLQRPGYLWRNHEHPGPV